MTLWISLAVMGVLAVLFVAWPLYRENRKFTVLLAAAIVLVTALSVGIYQHTGNPDVSSHADSLPGLDQTVALLAERLEGDPGDLDGWKMLGRSYMSLGNYTQAAYAFEKAVELESSKNAKTLVSLGVALLPESSGGLTERTAELFESALALEPHNQQALFYGGIAAINRGDNELAATRWEVLLGLNPPPEIQDVLRQRVAEWRGQPVQPAEELQPVEQTMPAEPIAPIEQAGHVIRVEVSLSESAVAAMPDEAAVYVIARDPAQPSPPIAVIRRSVSELPVVIDIGDSDSMMSGRALSGFAEFELIARVSLSGQASQQSGDWIGTALVRPADNKAISLQIDTQIR